MAPPWEWPEPAPPIADADGPYTISVGDPLILNASGSVDPDGQIVSYMWDLDNNGSFETNAGGQPFFAVDYEDVQDFGLAVGVVHNIHLKVTDSTDLTNTDSSSLTIVPEPATLSLLALGSLIALRRRRRRPGIRQPDEIEAPAACPRQIRFPISKGGNDMRWLILCVGAVALALTLCPQSIRAESIANGGFETGDLSHWTPSGLGYEVWWSVKVVSDGTEGTYCAKLEAFSERGPGVLHESTANLTSDVFSASAGSVLLFDYETASSADWWFDFDPNIALAYSQVIVRNDGNGNQSEFVLSPSSWIEFSCPITEAGQYTIEFKATPPGIESASSVVLYVDNVRLIPEPATLSLLALGSLVALRRRRR